jgi:heptaprenyl diphosphate synthase
VENLSKSKDNIDTRRLVLTGLLFAVALVLSVLEDVIPPLPIPVPGVKFGLSNIAVMYALFFLKRSQAYTIAALKSIFVLITRGLVAAALSFAGGILSLTVMLIMIILFKNKVTYLVLSMFGAIAHNIGQLIAISIIYTGMYLWAYLPVLLFSGAAAGIITAVLLKTALPMLNKAISTDKRGEDDV